MTIVALVTSCGTGLTLNDFIVHQNPSNRPVVIVFLPRFSYRDCILAKLPYVARDKDLYTQLRSFHLLPELFRTRRMRLM